MTNILSIPTDPLFDILVQVDDPLAITATCKDLRDYSDLLAQKLLLDIRNQTPPQDLCRILPIIDSELSASEKVKVVFEQVVTTHRRCWQYKKPREQLDLIHGGLPTVSLRRFIRMMIDIQVKADQDNTIAIKEISNNRPDCTKVTLKNLNLNFFPRVLLTIERINFVTLSENRLTFIPTEVQDYPLTCRYYDLSSNEITSIPWTTIPPNLRLYLGNNPIVDTQ